MPPALNMPQVAHDRFAADVFEFGAFALIETSKRLIDAPSRKAMAERKGKVRRVQDGGQRGGDQ